MGAKTATVRNGPVNIGDWVMTRPGDPASPGVTWAVSGIVQEIHPGGRGTTLILDAKEGPGDMFPGQPVKIYARICWHVSDAELEFLTAPATGWKLLKTKEA